MSLPNRELLGLIDEAATRLEPTEYGPWLGQQVVSVASDPTVPNAPTIAAAAADQAIDLTLTAPSTNTDGSQYLDHKEFIVYYSTSSGIDISNPSTYSGTFSTTSTKHVFATDAKHYFRAVAVDKYGNISAASNEVSATPTSTAQPVSVDDYSSNIANVYTGTGILGIEFQEPKSTWSRWAGWKLYYDVNDGGGWTGTWTNIYVGSGPGFLHKGLNESYAYKYKLTVLGEDGTETSGTISDNGGAGYVPNASDNSALVAVAIFAERIVATKEVRAPHLITDEAVITTSAQIQDAIITTAKIANAAITTAKIDDAAVTEAKIEDAAITTAKIGDLQVTDAKIANAAVTEAKIADAAITTAKIGNLQVTGAKIANATITSAKIADLTFDKITAGTNTASLVIGSGGYIKSSNYSAGSSGFIIYGNGNAEFNDVTVRGALVTQSGSQINADYLTAGTITGIIYRTSENPPRVEISPSSHSILIWEPGGTAVVSVGYDSLYKHGKILLGTPSLGTQLELEAFGPTITFIANGKIRGYSPSRVTLERVDGRFTYSGAQIFSGTCPSSWTDLDLSSYVENQQALVFIKVKNNAGTPKKYKFRMNGDTDEYSYGYDWPHCSTCTIAAGECGTVWVITDAARKIEWMSGVAESTTLWLLGYIT